MAVPGTAAGYPESFSYDESSQTLKVGKGEFSPVSKEVFEYSISGFEVVKSWLSYRMKKGAGRKSSKLDEIRPTQWTSAFTMELLNLLWILEATIKAFAEIEPLLEQVVKGETIDDVLFPIPTDAEREAPKFDEEHEKQPSLL